MFYKTFMNSIMKISSHIFCEKDKKNSQYDYWYDGSFSIIDGMRGDFTMKINDSLSNSNHNIGKKKGTFVVKIEFCQHGTWQGQVIWAEENRTERFRSALELIRLMDEAMASGAQVQIQETKTS